MDKIGVVVLALATQFSRMLTTYVILLWDNPPPILLFKYSKEICICLNKLLMFRLMSKTEYYELFLSFTFFL